MDRQAWRLVGFSYATLLGAIGMFIVVPMGLRAILGVVRNGWEEAGFWSILWALGVGIGGAVVAPVVLLILGSWGLCYVVKIRGVSEARQGIAEGVGRLHWVLRLPDPPEKPHPAKNDEESTESKDEDGSKKSAT